MTRSPRRSSIFKSFSRSPSSMRLTGTPVHRLTTCAISSAVTSSFTIACPLLCRSCKRLFGLFDLAVEIADFAVLNSGGHFEISLPLRLFEFGLFVVELFPAVS